MEEEKKTNSKKSSEIAISRGILNQGHGVNVRCVKD